MQEDSEVKNIRMALIVQNVHILKDCNNKERIHKMVFLLNHSHHRRCTHTRLTFGSQRVAGKALALKASLCVETLLFAVVSFFRTFVDVITADVILAEAVTILA